MARIFELAETLGKYWTTNKPRLIENGKLLEVYNGNVMDHLAVALASSFRKPDGTLPESYYQVLDRAVPINILKRIIDKKSKIYQMAPIRTVDKGRKSDKALLDSLLDLFKIDRQMNIVNEYFNLFDYAAVMPISYNGRTLLRPLANDCYLPWSDDRIDPTNPTHFLVFYGRAKDVASDEEVDLLTVYNDEEWAIIDEKGNYRLDIMGEIGNPEGINPFGVLPVFYFNRADQQALMPPIPTTMYRMSMLFPVLLSDLTYALKYQCFSIMYGIDIKSENLAISPNTFWELQSQPGGPAPQVGVIKPQVDSDKAMSAIGGMIALWLQTLNIRPGAIGDMSAEQFSSGISKIIDEMDTYEDRVEQISFFAPEEEAMLDVILKQIYPVWVENGDIENLGTFKPTAVVSTTFPEQLPMQNRKSVIENIEKELELGLESKRGAMQRLNPRMSEDEIKAKFAEIEEEKKAAAEAEGDEDDDRQREGTEGSEETEEGAN